MKVICGDKTAICPDSCLHLVPHDPIDLNIMDNEGEKYCNKESLICGFRRKPCICNEISGED